VGRYVNHDFKGKEGTHAQARQARESRKPGGQQAERKDDQVVWDKAEKDVRPPSVDGRLKKTEEIFEDET
jgi:hypothetical protein